MIPQTVEEAYERGYKDYGGQFRDEITGPNSLRRTGFFDFEADGLPALRIPFVATIEFGAPEKAKK